MKILALETSCDETAAAVVEYHQKKFRVLSNVVASQIKLHRRTGGVVPEVAAREHVRQIWLVIKKALSQAQIKPGRIDRLAVTAGPGLITSLMVGVETAKALSYLWQKPLVVVNHLEAHLAANFLPCLPAGRLNKKIIYPALGLIVSGGHTELILMKKRGSYQLVGATRDDAAGECLDKCAKILNLPYPGGPEIARRATRPTIDFPRPMIDSMDLDFSFAGLKTAVLYYTQKNKYKLGEVCASVQQAMVDVLVSKTKQAASKYKVKTIMLAGGVSANRKLREEFKKNFTQYNLLIPDLKYCTDQAAMVGAAAAYSKKAEDWKKIKIDPNWEL